MVLGHCSYYLEINSNFTTWFKRMCEYGFTEQTDFIPILEESNGGRPGTDFEIKLDMAKEIAMIQRSEKGKQARLYFIQVEKQWNSPEKVMARALIIANSKIENLQLENAQQKQMINELQPKATYYDLVLQNTSLIPISVIAKDYGMGAPSLNKKLEELEVQYKQGSKKKYVWLLRYKYQDKGYTFSKTQEYVDGYGKPQNKIHTYWTQKGRLFIYELLKQHGILPLIEREDDEL